MLQPLISICLPTLNARQFLEPRMRSILAQTLRDWELIACDSFSDDGTWEYLQQFKDDSRVRLYQVPKEGLYSGWNECLKRCRGEYVYIATADDTCSPELLERMVAALEAAKTTDCRLQTADSGFGVGIGITSGKNQYQNSLQSAVSGQRSDPKGLQSSVFSLQSQYPPLPADIAVCNFDYIDENGEIIAPPLPPAGAFYGDMRYVAHRRSGNLEFLVHLLIGTSWTTMTAVLFRRSLLEKTGLFVTDAGPLADRLWAYKSALFSDTIVVPDRLATWRLHPQQGTSPSRNRSMWNRRQLWRKTVEVVQECVPLMPVSWSVNQDFIDKLLWAERRHYYDLYHLNRTSLRYHPFAFLNGLCNAALLEQGFLVRRLLHGLPWSVDTVMLEGEYLKTLISDLHVGQLEKVK
jgi:glycosyltransferase involved in cell wall biosynthesis